MLTLLTILWAPPPRLYPVQLWAVRGRPNSPPIVAGCAGLVTVIGGCGAPRGSQSLVSWSNWRGGRQPSAPTRPEIPLTFSISSLMARLSAKIPRLSRCYVWDHRMCSLEALNFRRFLVHGIKSSHCGEVNGLIISESTIYKKKASLRSLFYPRTWNPETFLYQAHDIARKTFSGDREGYPKMPERLRLVIGFSTKDSTWDHRDSWQHSGWVEIISRSWCVKSEIPGDFRF